MSGKKILISFLLILVIIGGSVTAAFASSNVSSLLTNWFDRKTEDAIDDINNSIDQEIDKQTTRLKEELQPSIDALEKEIHSYTEKEKQKRIEELQAYVDELIENEKERSIDQEKYEQALHDIIAEAKEELNNVEPKVIKGNDNNNNMQTDNES